MTNLASPSGAPGGPPGDPRAVRPPVAPRRPQVLVAHGDERVDDWYWLAERDNPEVLALLEAENAHTDAVCAHTAALADRLYREMVGRVQETDLSVPARKGPFRYYTRTRQGAQYPLHCRRPVPPGEPDAPGGEEPAADDEPLPGEQVILDENEEAGDAAFFALGGLTVSPDHRLLAYATDTEGGERFTLRFRDLESGTTLPEVIEDTYYGLAWANDSATVFYTRPDRASRPHQLWRHRVGTAPSGDRCVHTEEDERFFVRVHKTKDDAAVIVSLEAAVTTEVRVVDADDPLGEPRVLAARRQGIEYEVEHRGGQFLIVTNDGAENFRLMAVPDRQPGRAHWHQALPHDPEVRLEGVEVFARHLVLVERADGYRRIRVANLDAEGIPLASTLRVLDQPEAVGTAWLGANLELDTTVLRYGYTSLITPRSVYEHDMATGRTVLRKRQPIRGGYDPATYRTERRWARTEDGEAVPISLVHRADVDPDGTAPCLLYGYGSYEVSVDPVFSSLRLSLLDRGVVVAIAHVRGGGELGRRWYREGALAAKHHTFTDFIACARHLVAEGWAAPDRLVARGASAGGLLMGAVSNQAPGLFAAIVAEVPFVDCLTTLMDPSLPLTVTEWEEWGNPVADPAAYRTIKAYSPYDNVGSHPYPRILATAGLNDARVAYWEPAKWVQKLRACAPGATVLLRTELGAGHQGPSGRYDAWRDEAVTTAFILDAMGLATPETAREGSGRG